MSLPPIELLATPIEWAGLPTQFMQPGELERLVTLVASVDPRSMIEIGVNVGRTAKVLLDHVATLKTYVGIDVAPDYLSALHAQRHETPVHPGHLVLGDPRFRLIIKPRGSLDLLPINLPLCDVMFIDGDHGIEAVKHDTMLAWSLVPIGGLIIWHDYANDIEHIDSFLEAEMLRGLDIRHVAQTWIAFVRV